MKNLLLTWYNNNTVTHFREAQVLLGIECDDIIRGYSLTLNDSKLIGGKKYHNQSFGGGIKFVDANFAELKMLKRNPVMRYFSLISNLTIDDCAECIVTAFSLLSLYCALDVNNKSQKNTANRLQIASFLAKK